MVDRPLNKPLVSQCFAVHWQLPQIRHSVPTDRFQSPDSVLAGLPVYLVQRLQSNYISDALVCLHCLRVPERLTYKVIHGLVPGYLGPCTRVADLPSRQSLRPVGTNRLVVPTSRLSSVDC